MTGYIYLRLGLRVLALSDFIFAYKARTQNRFELSLKSFTLGRGEVVFLHGRSGCGKTTLLNLLAGVIRSDLGERSRSIFGSICYVMHEPTLLPWLTVEHNLAAEGRLRAVRYSIEDFMYFATTFGLAGECLRLRPRSLSHGMRQRLEIAKALTFCPGLLLLDEGLSGIDTPTRRIVMRELSRIVSDRQLTIVATAHHAGDVLTFAQRVYILESGVLGTPISFSESIMDRLEMPMEKLYKIEGASQVLS